jgi:arabinan endo-1,5-alpha-L-arabinosidase
MKHVLLTAALALAAFGSTAKEVSVHDPVMAKQGDTWYVFSTGPGITFYSSKI